MGGLDIEYEMNCPSSGMSPQLLSERVSEMALDSVSIFKTSSGSDTFLHQNENFGASSSVSGCEFPCSPYSAVVQNEGMKPTSQLVNDPSNLNYNVFGSGSFLEMVGSFGLVPVEGQSQKASIKYPFSYVPNLNASAGGSEKAASTNDTKAHMDCVSGSSPNGKRRKCALDSTGFCPNKNAEGDLSMEPTEHFHSKSNGKQAKENSHSLQTPKENYVHVRARRGQATNSHSLAERVRREKIGERMKLLQELVPGCNQITGKAMMLDGIINYVQSLQQQVEFLSMKLASVDPELNFNSEHILFTDILHSSVTDGVHAIDHRLTTSHTAPHAVIQFHHTMPRTFQQLSSSTQTK